MVVLNGSRENFLQSTDSVVRDKFIVEVPVLERDEISLREERRRTGRYLAFSVIIFLVVLGLYHAISYGSPKMAALLGAALTMFLYLLWLLYAAQRRKRLLKESEKRVEEHVEKQVTNALQSLNNLKIIEAHDNMVYSSSDEEKELLNTIKRDKMKTQENEAIQNEKNCDLNKNDRPIFIRTYSIA